LLESTFSILFLLAISSLSVHSIIFSGWSSNSKYAFLGSIRSASQMISYELCISTIFLSIVLMTGSFSLINVVSSQSDVWFCVPLFPFFILFLIASLAETNRAPFDLPEAEAELVAGYNVEYSSIIFAMFFLAEYGNILIMSSISTLFFLGGWNGLFLINWIPSSLLFAIKVSLHVLFFILVRAAYPRYRYDHLMKLGWKVFLPLSFFLLVLQSILMLIFNIFPSI
jgi:NADH-quinone oxidoreductase subunit H